MVRSVREISYRLLPPSIDSPSLVRALEDLISRIETPGVAILSVSSEGKEFSLNTLHQAHLVRIVQELVYNALSIACAGMFTLSLNGLMIQ